ncbi:pyridoxamine 5'-phosphate oxidase family protein [Agromyces bauzanensis]|uniref:Flavin-nucleotide-binding protein n=1 Tax=Agromyces bauzanensis TaxID=1308924 RepID=A0A917PIM0_9MICO|nr:flavin-nucleotide-binding protein [Agromyces bauzanensis]
MQELDYSANQCARETSSVTPTNATSPRRIRRLPERQTADRIDLFALLDDELVGHLAAVVDGEPVVVPMGYARDGEHLLLHGSTGGGFALRAADERATVAFAVTALDGLVYARSLFDSSMNYRSAVVYGVLETVPADETDAALIALSERLMPGRPAEVRGTTRKETAATRVLRLALDDVVMKARAGGASEDPDDGEDHIAWAGVVPLVRSWGPPSASALTPAGTPIPDSVVARMTRSTGEPTPTRKSVVALRTRPPGEHRLH